MPTLSVTHLVPQVTPEDTQARLIQFTRQDASSAAEVQILFLPLDGSGNFSQTAVPQKFILRDVLPGTTRTVQSVKTAENPSGLIEVEVTPHIYARATRGLMLCGAYTADPLPAWTQEKQDNYRLYKQTIETLLGQSITGLDYETVGFMIEQKCADLGLLETE